MMWCPVDREILTNELHSQPILNNFYSACAETAVAVNLQFKKIDPNFEFVVHDVLKDVKIFEFDGRIRPLLAIYLLRMQRKRSLFCFRFKIWPRYWVVRVRFPIGPYILAIEPRFQPLFANFLLRMRRKQPHIYFLLKTRRQIWALRARFLLGREIFAITRCLGQFLLNRLLRMHKTAIFVLSGKIWFLVVRFQFDYEIWWHLRQPWSA